MTLLNRAHALVPQIAETGQTQNLLQVNDHIVGAHPTEGTNGTPYPERLRRGATSKEIFTEVS